MRTELGKLGLLLTIFLIFTAGRVAFAGSGPQPGPSRRKQLRVEEAVELISNVPSFLRESGSGKLAELSRARLFRGLWQAAIALQSTPTSTLRAAERLIYLRNQYDSPEQVEYLRTRVGTTSDTSQAVMQEAGHLQSALLNSLALNRILFDIPRDQPSNEFNLFRLAQSPGKHSEGEKLLWPILKGKGQSLSYYEPLPTQEIPYICERYNPVSEFDFIASRFARRRLGEWTISDG